ncbi:hypothetical protein [Sphingobacterium pedocola]|nr:hypothetical protein [Sphingobacterium pedocola]
MNKFIKKSIAVAGAVALALTATVGFSAFKHVEKENKVLIQEAWFAYDGVGLQNSASSYIHMETPASCEGNTTLCAIKVDNPSQNPEDGLDQSDLNALLAQENPSNPTEFPAESSNVEFRN